MADAESPCFPVQPEWRPDPSPELNGWRGWQVLRRPHLLLFASPTLWLYVPGWQRLSDSVPLPPAGRCCHIVLLCILPSLRSPTSSHSLFPLCSVWDPLTSQNSAQVLPSQGWHACFLSYTLLGNGVPFLLQCSSYFVIMSPQACLFDYCLCLPPLSVSFTGTNVTVYCWRFENCRSSPPVCWISDNCW